MADLYGIKNFL